MRTQTRNKRKLWMVYPTGYADNVDSFGNFTGEKSATYSVPVEVFICLSPIGGKINYSMQGAILECDEMITTTNYTFGLNTLFFKTQPTANFGTTFDYRLDVILESLNSTTYGLKARR